jgi:uncharacterized iron-regulated membrane protein
MLLVRITAQGGSGAVGSTAVLVAIIVLAVGGYVGWQLRHAYGANSDLKVHKNRIPNFRKTRNRSGLTSVLLVLGVLFLLRLLMK